MLILILMLILMIQRNYPLHGHRRYHRELELSNREPPSGAGALRPGGFVREMSLKPTSATCTAAARALNIIDQAVGGSPSVEEEKQL